MESERIVVRRRGGPDALELERVPVPRPGPGEVVVRMQAAGVAYADVMMREGLYPGVGLPVTPGYDVVGTVEAVGEGVADLAPGQAVAALTVFGSYARHVRVPAAHAVPIPDGLDPAEAVSLVLNYLTAFQMLHRSAHVSPGDSILVHGAAGGVGTAMLQLARLANVRAFGTASAGKHDLVRALGGIPIDYRTDDFVARVRAEAKGGVEAAFDPIGGANWARSHAALAPTGTLVVFGAYDVLAGGRRDLIGAARMFLRTPRISPIRMLGDNKGVVPYTVTAWRDRRPGLYRQDLITLFTALADRRIAPVVAERVPLAEAARAHALLGGAKIAGKIVLV
jgi:NADPH:quinone reductase-like Zn-dependent oxidoreductase